MIIRYSPCIKGLDPYIKTKQQAEMLVRPMYARLALTTAETLSNRINIPRVYGVRPQPINSIT